MTNLYLINDYLNSGGKVDLVCVINYFYDNIKIKQDSLKNIIAEEYTKYIILGNPPDELITQEQTIKIENSKI